MLSNHIYQQRAQAFQILWKSTSRFTFLFQCFWYWKGALHTKALPVDIRENQKITALIIVLVSLLLTLNRYTPFDTDHIMSNDKFLTKSATFPTNSNSKIVDTNNHDSSSSTITQKITVSSPQEYVNIFQWFYKKGITLESKGKIKNLLPS